MRNLVITLLAICSLTALSAQSRQRLISSLSEPTKAKNSLVGAVEVHQDSGATEALKRIDAEPRSSHVMGYRVGIFFDNGQDARFKAAEARTLFREHFSVPVYMVYESPYYKVSAGDCLTEEEAIILFERIRPIFPNAYVMRERMALSDFIVDESVVDEPIEKPIVDSLEVTNSAL